MQYEVVGRLIRIGDLQSLLGRSNAALASYKSALTLLEPIIQVSPQVEAGYSDLVMIHNKTGYVRLQLGDPSGAIQSYGKARDVAQARADKDSSSVYWKRMLAIVHGGLGDVLLQQPMPSPADTSRITAEVLASYNRSYQLTEEFAGLDPANQAWQFDLWYAHSRLGRVRTIRGENLVALEHYSKGLTIMEALAATNPTVAVYQRQLGMTHSAIGLVRIAQGKRTDALASFRKALEQGEKAAAMEPSVIEYKRDIALYSGSVGQVQAMDGDFAAALTRLEAHREHGDAPPAPPGAIEVKAQLSALGEAP